MIDLRNIRVTFNPGTALETRALWDLGLLIPEGQFVSVIGSNGAGKSTLLNAIAGETGVDQGSVLIDDIDVTGWSTARRAQMVARVFQDPMAGTCENLTIEENLALASARGHRRGLKQAVSRERRGEFQDRITKLGLGLDNRLCDRMGLLSGGQRQAVSLVMATLNPTKILLLDEHTAALDPKTAAYVMELTERIVSEEGLTTMMVTHSMRQALDHGERTLMLHEGRIVLDVTGEERKGLQVEDLLHMFEKVNGHQLDDDKLLLG